MSTQSTLSDLEAYLASLTIEEKRLLTELERVRETKDAVNLVLSVYPEWKRATPKIGANTGANISPQDIADSSSQAVALVRIAEQNGGYLRARTAAKLLMEAGLTTSKNMASATASVYRRVNLNRDWERHEPGIFRYLPFFALENGSDRTEETTAETTIPETEPSVSAFEANADVTLLLSDASQSILGLSGNDEKTNAVSGGGLHSTGMIVPEV